MATLRLPSSLLSFALVGFGLTVSACACPPCASAEPHAHEGAHPHGGDAHHGEDPHHDEGAHAHGGDAHAHGGDAHAHGGDAHDGDQPAASDEPALTLALPAWTNEGKPIELAVLHEDASLKIAAIALRQGAELPVHEVEARITIEVVQGSGQLSLGERSVEVSPGSIVVAEPSLPHAMKPSDTELVVLLVHYLK